MVFHHGGDKPVSEPMMTYLIYWCIYVSRGLNDQQKIKKKEYEMLQSCHWYAEVSYKT